MNHNRPTLPKLPGIYLFKDAQGNLLYVGKALNLHDRVGSYFAQYKTDWKVKALLDEHATIGTIITNTEHDALVLEAQLIQEYQPKYNRLLKEGNPFVYICYTKKPNPTFTVTRTRTKKGIYFGPFIKKTDARKTLHFITNTFKLYRCGRHMIHGCLMYHIGTCSGSCLPTFDETAYNFRAELALFMLRNEREQFVTNLEQEIKKANVTFQFERAKHLYEYLQHVDTLFNTLNRYTTMGIYTQEAATHITPLPTQEHTNATAMELQQLIGSSKPIHTIDCFDISHFQSRNIVGSCVRFTEGVPDKQAFRRFIIRSVQQQNDYAALQEIVQRRYKQESDIPDLILIDGGIGQRNAILALLPTNTIASLAKREETIYSAAHPNGIVLDMHKNADKLLIALRDYTHHFVITYHRLKQRIRS